MGFRSQQDRILKKIDHIAQEARFIPETRAFREIASPKISEMKDFLEGFVPKPGQTGFMIKVRGKIVGMEFLSSNGLFSKLARKILGGFALDALFNLDKGISFIGSPKSFLKEVRECQVEVFGSVGYGKDLRLSGEKIVGSSLVHEGTVIHGFLLAKGDDSASARISSIADY